MGCPAARAVCCVLVCLCVLTKLQKRTKEKALCVCCLLLVVFVLLDFSRLHHQHAASLRAADGQEPAHARGAAQRGHVQRPPRELRQLYERRPLDMYC